MTIYWAASFIITSGCLWHHCHCPKWEMWDLLPSCIKFKSPNVPMKKNDLAFVFALENLCWLLAFWSLCFPFSLPFIFSTHYANKIDKEITLSRVNYIPLSLNAWDLFYSCCSVSILKFENCNPTCCVMFKWIVFVLAKIT